MNTPDYNLKQLLSMIDTAINAFIENGDCTLCRIYNCQDNRCLNIDLCKNLLFDGLLMHSREDCPKKIRDKEQNDVNEFLERHIVHIVKPFSGFTTVRPKKKAKVSSDGSKARGGSCDTGLDSKR